MEALPTSSSRRETEEAFTQQDERPSVSNKTRLKINFPFLVLYTFTVGIGMFQTCIVLVGVGATMPIMKLQLGWTDAENLRYSTFITSAAVFGMSVGSVMAGRLINKGRRRGGLIMCVIAIFGGIFQQFMTVPTMIIGRVLYGFAAGTLSVVLGKSIVETIPEEYIGTFGSATQISIGLGISFQQGLGFILPTDQESMMTTQRWRIVHSSPSVIGLL